MKKISLIFCFLGYLVSAFSATRTISNAGGNFNSTSTWVEGAVPTAADDVVATATSGKLIVNVNSVAKTITLTNYVDTLVMNANLSVSGAVTLATGMQYTGSSNLICITTATLTSNGIPITGGLQLNGTSQTFTLADNWTVNGLLTCGGATATTINGNTLTCNGGYTQTNVATVSGTTAFILAGGTWSSTLNSNVLRNNLTFAGDVTLGINVAYNTGTLTYTSGTVTTTNSTLTSVASTTFNCAAIGWNNVVFGGTSQTFTLNADLDVNGLFTCNGTTATTINGAYNVKLGGGYTQTTVLLVSGTATFLFDGKGTWNGGTTLVLTNNLTINTADSLFIGIVAYGTGTFTYTAGTVVTSGSTLRLTNAINFSSGIDLINWNNLTLSGTSQTYALNENLIVAGTLSLTGTTAMSFTGAYNFTCGSLVLGTTTIALPGCIVSAGSTTVNSGTVLNGYKLYTSGLTMNSSISGSTCIVLTGGTWIGTGTVFSNTTLAGDVTISGQVYFGTTLVGDSLIYLSGSITTAGSTLNFSTGGTYAKLILDLAGISFNHINFILSDNTVTFVSNFDINGNLYLNSGATPSSITMNGSTVYVAGSMTSSGGNGVKYKGNSNFVLDGKGTINLKSLQSFAHNLTINTIDTITFVRMAYNTGTLNYLAGTILTAGSTLEIGPLGEAIPTVSTAGMTWHDVNCLGPVTLGSDMNMTGSLSLGDLYQTYYSGPYTFKVGGSLSVPNSTHTPRGVSTILLQGKGTISSVGSLGLATTINTTDTITIGSNLSLYGTTFTYNSGTVVSTGSTFSCKSVSSTINVNASGFNLNVFSGSISTNFGGSFGFPVKTFISTTPGITFTFAAGNTYEISDVLTLSATSASRILFKSSIANTAATVNLGHSAIEDIAFVNFTDIINTKLPIWTYKGILTRSSGVSQLKTEPQTISYTF